MSKRHKLNSINVKMLQLTEIDNGRQGEGLLIAYREHIKCTSCSSEVHIKCLHCNKHFCRKCFEQHTNDVLIPTGVVQPHKQKRKTCDRCSRHLDVGTMYQCKKCNSILCMVCLEINPVCACKTPK